MTSNPLHEDLSDSLESIQTADSQSNTIEVLKKRKIDLDLDIILAGKEWKPSGLFDHVYWSRAAKVEKLSVQREIIDRKISQGSFSGKEIDWEATEEVKRILERINAYKQTERIYKARLQNLLERGRRGL